MAGDQEHWSTNLRSYLLKNDVVELSALMHNSEVNKDHLYRYFCDFYDECDVKNVNLHEDVRTLITRYVVNYQFVPVGFCEQAPIEAEGHANDAIKNRISALVKVMENHPMQSEKEITTANIEQVVVNLKFLAKTMNTLKFEKSVKQIPWTQLQFVICTFLATITMSWPRQHPYIDRYFQLMFDWQLICNSLTELKRCLADYTDTKVIELGNWRELNNKYKITRNYYLLKKIWCYLNHMREITVSEFRNSAKVFERTVQAIAECFLQMEQLQYPSEEDLVTKIHNLKSSLIQMRDNLSHATFIKDREDINSITNNSFKHLYIDILKLATFVAQSIRRERRLIAVLFLDELQDLNDTGRTINRLNGICTQTNDNKLEAKLKNMKFIQPITDLVMRSLDLFGNNYPELKDQADVVQKQLDTVEEELDINQTDYDIFDLVNLFKSIQNLELAFVPNQVLCYKKLFKISSLDNKKESLVVLSREIYSFFMLIPDSKERKELTYLSAQLLLNDKLASIKSKVNPVSNDTIERILSTILKSTEGIADKSKLETLFTELKLKRELFLKAKATGNVEAVKAKWPTSNTRKKVSDREITTYSDPLEMLITLINRNISLPEAVEQFLEPVSLTEKEAIFLKVKQDYLENIKTELSLKIKEMIDLDRNLVGFQYIMEMYFIICIELMKLLGVNLRPNRNYLDYKCPIPVARNFRNFVAHGDIYLELFSADFQETLNTHNRIIATMKIEQVNEIGFTAKDDMEKALNILKIQQSWISSKVDILNYKFDFNIINNYIHDPISFKSRDINGLTIVHYNLKNIDRENPFLIYLIEKLVPLATFKPNILFDLMLKDSRTPNYRPFSIQDFNANSENQINSLIQNMINVYAIKSKRLILSQILCFTCPDLELFKTVFMNESNDSSCENNHLHIATANNQKITVEYLLKYTFYSPCFDDLICGQTALQIATQNLNIELVQLLIKFGADLSIYDEEINRLDLARIALEGANRLPSPVCIAAKAGNLGLLETFHSCQADFNTVDARKNSPLHLAIIYSANLDSCKFLIKNFPSLLDFANEKGEFPIHLACMLGKQEIIQFMLENGSSLDKWDCSNTNCSMHYACMGDNNVDFIQFLIGNGAPVNSPNQISPLMLAANAGKADIVKVLIENGALIDQETPNKLTALLYAIYGDQIETVDVLLNTGAIINQHFLTYSAIKIKMLKHLLSKEKLFKWSGNGNPLKEVHVVDDFVKLKLILGHLKSRKIPVIAQYVDHAILKNNMKSFELLINYPYLQYNKESLANLFWHAIAQNKVEMVKELIKFGADIQHIYAQHECETPLHRACEIDEGMAAFDLVEYLLQMGANVNAVRENNVTPLMISAEHGNPKIIKLLLDYEADANIQMTIKPGYNAIQLAIHGGNLEAIKLLHNFDVANSFFLSQAITGKNKYVIDYLLGFDYNVNWSMETEKNPLCIAISLKDHDLVAKLLKRGSMLDGDFHPFSPIDLAFDLSDDECISIIQNHL